MYACMYACMYILHLQAQMLLGRGQQSRHRLSFPLLLLHLPRFVALLLRLARVFASESFDIRRQLCCP